MPSQYEPVNMNEYSHDTAYTVTDMKQPISTVSRTSGFESLAGFEKQDKVYKKRIRILRFVSRTISVILSAIMIGILSYTLAKYYLTRNHIIAGNVHPWATPATVWPTYMLLAIAAITFTMNLITLISYCCGVDAANRLSSVTSIVSYILLGVHVIAWAVATGLFRMARKTNDLWGYSCSSQADKIQEQLESLQMSFVNFGQLCTIQNGAWGTSIIQTVEYLITFLTTIFMLQRANIKKKITKVRSGLSVEEGI